MAGVTSVGAKPLVLVVDDEADLRGAYGEILQEEGCEVAMAANGAEALSVLASLKEAPCLILLDLMMPVLDGYGFLARLRANPTLPPIPVLVVSASEGPLPDGAQGWLRKPFRLDALLAEVTRYCLRA